MKLNRIRAEQTIKYLKGKMKKLLLVLLFSIGPSFGQLLPPSFTTYYNVKLLNIQIRDVDGFKGPIFLVKYDPTLEAKWVRPFDPAMNNVFLSFAFSAISMGNTLTIVTGSGDSNTGFQGLTVMKFDDPPN